MPTLIDSLVVELRLDPRGFTAAQRQVVTQLRQLQGTATQAAQQTTTATSKSLQGFLAGFLQQLQLVNLQLLNLGAQSRRAGTNVAAGGNTAATGFASLARQALAAYAALKTVQGMLKTIGDTAAKGASTGRVAELAGVSPSWLESMKRAANIRAQVEGETTQNTINEYAKRLQAFKQYGQYSEQFTYLQHHGIDLTASVEQQFSQIQKVLQGMTGPQAQAFGQVGGFEALVSAFRDPRFEETRKLQEGILSHDQVVKFAALKSAIASLETGIDGFINKIVEVLAPDLTRSVESLDNFIREIQKIPEVITGMTDVLRILKDVIKQFINMIPGLNLYLAYSGTGPKPTDTLNWWQKTMPKWLGGKDQPPGSGNPAGTRPSAGGPLPQAAIDAIARAEGTYKNNAIDWNALGDGRPSHAGLTGMTLAQAQALGGDLGGLQINAGTLGDAWKGLGLDPTTTKFTPEVQQQLASWVHQKQGANAWVGLRKHPEEMTNFNTAVSGGLSSYASGNARPGGASPVSGLDSAFASRITAMTQDMPPDIRRRFEIISGYRSSRRQGQVNPRVTDSHHTNEGFGTGRAVDLGRDPDVLTWVRAHGHRYGVGFPLLGQPGEENHLEPMNNSRRVPNRTALNLIRSANAGTTTNSSTDQSTAVNTGNIYVTSPPGADGNAHGLAIGGALKRSFLTTNLNTAQE